jgi:hypothetical protein
MGNAKLNSLEIFGFRIFRHLQLEHLGMVNLIVGKNNVGKSCLLEALYLYAHRGLPWTIQELLEWRDENSKAFNTRTEEIDTSIVRHLFYGRQDFGKQPQAVQIGPIASPNDTLSIVTSWYEERTSPDGIRRQWQKLAPEQFNEVDNLFPGFDIKLGAKQIISYPLHLLLRRPLRPLVSPQQVEDIRCVFIPANGLDEKQVSLLWDSVALTRLEEDVFHALHIIASEVERVNLLGREQRGRRIPMARVEGWGDPVPLRSLGEGLNRLFGIALALVNAKDGLLLIDEVESGLHYSVHTDLWRLIFQVADRLNVQVFATTHSWDCIEGFQKSAQEEEYRDGMLIRLENRKGEIIPILFDEHRLGIATREDIEVR